MQTIRYSSYFVIPMQGHIPNKLPEPRCCGGVPCLYPSQRSGLVQGCTHDLQARAPGPPPRTTGPRRRRQSRTRGARPAAAVATPGRLCTRYRHARHRAGDAVATADRDGAAHHQVDGPHLAGRHRAAVAAGAGDARSPPVSSLAVGSGPFFGRVTPETIRALSNIAPAVRRMRFLPSPVAAESPRENNPVSKCAETEERGVRQLP